MTALLLMLTLAQSPRLALAVGSNVGGEGRDQLWFAEADAERFADALVELGQFEKGDVTVLKGPTAAELTQALGALGQRIRQCVLGLLAGLGQHARKASTQTEQKAGQQGGA